MTGEPGKRMDPGAPVWALLVVIGGMALVAGGCAVLVAVARWIAGG